jgi:cobalt-precorrin-5B (C1)-methyltransferase
MTDDRPKLRRGWTTGACATAATRAALMALWGEGFPERVRITLPRGERPEFALSHRAAGPGWAEAGIIKDAGDDPDVTHLAEIRARVSVGASGVTFLAGEGVGLVTRAGLPVPPGEPAINPVPRQMMTETVVKMAARLGKTPDIEITISIPDGVEMAKKTWNPRLGIKGGLSVLGTTGIVRPFSCSAWIASIHRGVDVARAAGQRHVAGCTGATSEKVVQAQFGLPDFAMMDMGDFAGGLLKYLRKHPIERVTIGGGIGKLTKLAQGAIDLHSGRSQVDFDDLAERLGDPALREANTALQVYEIIGDRFAAWVAEEARLKAQIIVGTAAVIDTLVIDRAGRILGTSCP